MVAVWGNNFFFFFLNLCSQRVTEAQNIVKLTDRMWARLLASTNQPSFVSCEVVQERVGKQLVDDIHNLKITSI